MLSRTLASMPAASKIRLWQAHWRHYLYFSTSKASINSGFTGPSPCSHTCLERARAWSRQQRLLLRQYLYFCTSIASKLSTLDIVSCVPERREGDERRALLQQRQLPSRPEQAQVANRQHTSAYVSIRQRPSAYVGIRQHTSQLPPRPKQARVANRQHTSAYVSVRQHTSAYVGIPGGAWGGSKRRRARHSQRRRESGHA